MILIVGLGNPGKKYENTPHNVGFSILDILASENKWEKDKLAQCFYLRKKLNKQDLILAKPFTFVNESGQTVKYLQKKYHLEIKDVVIIHDDLDLPLGKIKICQNHSSAGHKGVQSIIDYLKTKKFVRIRIGVRPEKLSLIAEKFVLKKFSLKEKVLLKNVFEKTIEAIWLLTEKGLEATMNKYN